MVLNIALKNQKNAFKFVGQMIVVCRLFLMGEVCDVGYGLAHFDDKGERAGQCLDEKAYSDFSGNPLKTGHGLRLSLATCPALSG